MGLALVTPIIAEHLSARHLILLRMRLYVCMYVYMYICPSRLGMLIFCMWRALEIQHVHTAAPLLSVGLSAQVIKYAWIDLYYKNDG